MVLLNSVYDGKQRKEPKLNIVSKLGKIPRKRKLFGVRLDINTPDGIDPTTFPYVFAISVYGCFQCDDIPDKIEKEAFLLKRKLVYVNGSTILYSAARDRLMLLTGGTPYPSYCLPTYRFDPEDIK
jgi:hypothetical protein